MFTYKKNITFTCALSFLLLSNIFLIDLASAKTSDDGYYLYSATDDRKTVNQNRKFLLGVIGSQKPESMDQGKPKYEVEMRHVPAGPDPMHHHSGPQKRPGITTP